MYMKRKSTRRRTFRRNRKTRKRCKRGGYKKRGGDIDKLNDPDFNSNLAFDKKQTGGANLGAGCPDPNFSIYNTNELKLFPYKP
jgi:hypothetical protein